MSRFSVEHEPRAFETYVLRDHDAGSLVELVPARGALVTRFRAPDGREVLYLDEATLRDPSKNVRGGIPLLFPIAGRLEGDRYALPDGRSFELKQHGFARNLAWAVRERDDRDEAAVTLELRDDERTRAAFPYEFSLRVTVALRGASLALRFACENRGEGPLPLHLGLHPYFALPASAKASARVRTGATQAFDNVRKAEAAFRADALALDAGEVDLHLRDHDAQGTTLEWLDEQGARRAVALSWSELFDTLVLWTLPDKPFVCVEPWSGPAGALATGRGLRSIDPGETLRGEVTVTAP